MNRCQSCNKDMDSERTHWDGCHTSHPECAAYRAGYEAGMRMAAVIAGTMAERPYDSSPEFEAVLAVEAAILAELGK